MREGPLYTRTKQFAIDAVSFAISCKRAPITDVLTKQFVRSSTSVGANYRAAFRARSTAECIAKLGIVEEEADETLYWLDLLAVADPSLKNSIELMEKEMSEILAMVVASKLTLKKTKK